MENGDGHGSNCRDELDFRSYNSSPVRRRAQQRLNRVRGALNRSCSVPDSNNPPSLSPTSCSDISIPVTDLTEIGADEQPSSQSMWRLERLNRGKSCECYTVSSIEDYMNSTMGSETSQENLNEPLHIDEPDTEVSHEEECKDHSQVSPSPCNSCQDLEMEQDSCGIQTSLNNSLYSLNNHMTKSMLCLNEESQDEVSLVCASILFVFPLIAFTCFNGEKVLK